MKRITLGLIIASLYGTASADFTVIDPSQSVTQPPVQAAPPVQTSIPNNLPAATPAAGQQQKQAPGQKISTVPSANMTSLVDTLKKVTPKGWKVYSDKTLNTSVPVEYMPAADWKQSLAALSNRYNLVFTVDEAKKTIKLDQGPGGMRDTTLDNQKLAQNNLVPEKMPAAVAPDGSLQLIVKDHQLLSEALEQFLRAGNWEMVWEAGSDINVEKGFSVADKDLNVLLTKALSKFKLHAVLHPKNNVAAIKSDAVIE